MAIYDEYSQPVLQDISRQRKLADQLRAQSEEPLNGQMVSGIYVAPSWSQYLAKGLKSYMAGDTERNANKKEADYAKTKAQKIADFLKGNQAQTTQQGTTDTSVMPAFTPEQQDRFGSPLQGVKRNPVVTSTPNMVTESPDQVQQRQRDKAMGLVGEFGYTPEIQLAMQQLNHQQARGEHIADIADQRGYDEKLYNRGRADKLSDTEAEHKYQDIVMKEQQGFQTSMQDKQFAQQYKLQAQSQGFQAGQNKLNRDQAKELAGVNEPPVQVIDPKTGKPVFVTRKQSFGMQPYSAAADARQISADTKLQSKAEGAGIVDNNIALLRDAYKQLDEGGGIVSSEHNNKLGNLRASMSGSSLGQSFGGAIGTKNQTQRDKIEQTRPLLLQSIMKATGMSAKQMDSNAELKLWLSTATDPTKSLEANRDALDNIERMYGSSALGKSTGTTPKEVDFGSLK